MKLLILLFKSFIFLALYNCDEPDSLTKSADNYSNLNLAQNEIESIKSIEKLDDYPFYKMTYFGDYKFAEYIKTGTRDQSVSNLSFSFDNLPKWACSCFATFGDTASILFGRNFDFIHRSSLLLFTDSPDGYASVSMVDIFYCGYEINVPLDNPGECIGLLDAPYYPFDGLNEMGVSIGLMAVPYAQSPVDPQKVTIYELAVIRLVLDYAEDLDSAILLIQSYNVRTGSIPVHFLIADKTGESAIVEFVDSKVVVHKNTQPFQVSTNFIIKDALPNLLGNCWRYDKMYKIISENNGVIDAGYAMHLLKDVSQDNTMWSAVYNLSNGNFSISVGRKFDKSFNFHLPVR